jgi:hypothetical protein
MGHRQCIANHWLVESQHGMTHWSNHIGKWEISKKDHTGCHTTVHFENLMEEDVLNTTVKEGSPLPKVSLI